MFVTVDENYKDAFGTPCVRTLYTNCAQHLVYGTLLDGRECFLEKMYETLDYGKQGVTKIMHVKPVATPEERAAHMVAFREQNTRMYIAAQLRREDAGVGSG